VDIPTFLTSLATLLASLTALIKVLQVQRQGQETHDTLRKVDSNTNGSYSALQQNVSDLRSSQATPAEVAARTDPGPRTIRVS
jgi:hypothetical protein